MLMTHFAGMAVADIVYLESDQTPRGDSLSSLQIIAGMHSTSFVVCIKTATPLVKALH